MIQKVGFSAGNWDSQTKALKTAARALTQGPLKEMTKGSPKTGAVDLITLPTRGQFAGAVHDNFLTLTPRGQFKGAVHQG